MHTEIGPAGGTHGGDWRRRRFSVFDGRRAARRRSRRFCRRGGGFRRRWRSGSCCGRLRRCGVRRGCRRRWRRCRRRALRRSRSDGVERRFARWRYFGSIALETFKRIPSARLNAGALRHEIGAARGANRRDLLRGRLLGEGGQRRHHDNPTRQQRAHCVPRTPPSRTSRKSPFFAGRHVAQSRRRRPVCGVLP